MENFIFCAVLRIHAEYFLIPGINKGFIIRDCSAFGKHTEWDTLQKKEKFEETNQKFHFATFAPTFNYFPSTF